MIVPTISQQAIEAIVGGYHGDPFSVLGAHHAQKGIVIRAFLPQATSVSVIISKKTAVMTQLHSDGFFQLELTHRKRIPNYELEITTPDGRSYRQPDPYSFPPMLSDYDEYLLAQGNHHQIYNQMGAHLVKLNGYSGTRFAVWAPSAERVSVIGDFNDWNGHIHPMRFHHNSGIWELFVPNLPQNTVYKYEIKTRQFGYTVQKSDPLAFAAERRPNTASIIWDINQYQWQDNDWMKSRQQHNSIDAPISIYECHLGSWRRNVENDGWLTYTELAQTLIPYVQEMGYTHIELLPITEYPYDGSWGYQVTGYFAPTSRHGTPDEFMAFIDACHQANIGVILDWVPAHFPKDQHGLAYFDGTHLYEHAHPLQGEHPDWGTLIFNYGRPEVSQFLLNSALFWLDKYHIDGLRVDAVASMIYLDFSREDGEWIPNRYGGRENIEAIQFVRHFNEIIHQEFPDTLTIAEESTSFPGVTHAITDNGLGFDLKWNMGWMHDTLKYMQNDPIYRSHHHGTMTFSLMYAFSEKFMLPFSHDEVVHLKKSMLDKMPGDAWRKFANLRLLYGYQWSHPGKKLQFMGGEIGQWREWSEARSLDWHLLDQDDKHRGLQSWVRDLNQFYTEEACLHEDDYSWDGFEWIDLHDTQRSILSYRRKSALLEESVLIVCNFTPVVREDYWLEIPAKGYYSERLNSDADIYGGSNIINEGILKSTTASWDKGRHILRLTLPPLGIIFLQQVASEEE